MADIAPGERMQIYNTTCQIIAEIDRVLSKVDEAEINELFEAILKANHIKVHLQPG
jgi:hypothetical protein